MGLPAPDELRTPAVSILNATSAKLQRMSAGLNTLQAAMITMPPIVPMKILMALNKGKISKFRERACGSLHSTDVTGPNLSMLR